jgi:hypothetical protein
MINLETKVQSNNLKAQDIFSFMLNCDDEKYQTWWPENHFSFHTIKRNPNNNGNLVFFDEMVGKRRLKFTAVIIKLITDKEIVWQMKKLVMLPAWLSLKFDETKDGLIITHKLSVGFNGFGKIFDPILKLYLNDKFEKDLAAHAETEFKRL